MPIEMCVIDPKGVYSRRRLAEALEVSEKTIDRQVLAGELPPPFRQGGRCYWRGDVLLEWFDRRQKEVLREAGMVNGHEA